MQSISAMKLLTCAVAFCVALESNAQDIALKSRDNSLSISGTFLGFDGEFYRVETEFGILTVDSAGVVCEGPSCLDLSGFYPHLRVSVDGLEASTMSVDLVSAFAARYGYSSAVDEVQNNIEIELNDEGTGETKARFEISRASAAEGLSKLLVEDADMVVSLREATTTQKEQALDAHVADWNNPIRARVMALDAILPVVSDTNPLDTISLGNLERLLTGGIANWSEIGGADAPVVLYAGPELQRLNGNSDDLIFQTGQVLSPEAQRMTSNARALAAVAGDPYGLTFGRLSTAQDLKVLNLTGACGFQAGNTSADVKTEDYPMVEPVFLYTPARRLPKVARDFISYALSPAAQDVIGQSAFVDQAVEELSFRDQGRRFANAIARAGDEVSLIDLQDVTSVLAGSRRLSLGFRFEDGSSRLDAQSRSNVQMLAQLLEAGLYDQHEISFVGFSDGQGAAIANKSLSEKRADAVWKSVERALGDAFEPDHLIVSTLGFGEAMPLACDDVAWGRSLNRRVEVWVKDISYK